MTKNGQISPVPNRTKRNTSLTLEIRMPEEQVKFARTTSFLGRNGHMKCGGIDITSFGSSVTLSPLTSRGVIGRCNIEIPLENLPEVIAKLQSLLPGLRKA